MSRFICSATKNEMLGNFWDLNKPGIVKMKNGYPMICS